jgi:hypothetical protein
MKKKPIIKLTERNWDIISDALEEYVCANHVIS